MIELVRNFLEELRNLSKSQMFVPKSCTGTITNNCGDTSERIKELEEDIDGLNSVVHKLKQENKDFKNRLNAKKQKLSDCLCVLEKNENNIKNLTEDVDNIVYERNKYMQENLELKSKIQVFEDELNMQSNTKRKLLAIEDAPKSNTQSRGCSPRAPSSPCRSQSEDDDQLLIDTIKILTEENKSNLQVIRDLTNKVNEINSEKKDMENELKEQNQKLLRDLEMYNNQSPGENTKSYDEGKCLQFFGLICT